mmetsp:Transcript_36171/g.102259  ORF Transcript_36171/g.102259 Transcript_36171/m.102259 type:complete len:634 (-) Transcript_36171:176-2077(-)
MGFGDHAKRLCGRSVWGQLSCRGADVNGFFQLLFDNVANALTMSFLLSSNGLGLLADEDIYGGYLPGLGITMLFGNIYYCWMALRLSNHTGRKEVTSQPYGINTPGAFAFLYGVLLPVAYGTTCPSDMELDSAECASWKSSETLRVGVAANFVQGLLAILLGLIAPQIQKVCPVASLVSALGGIGITFLGIGQIIYSYDQPLAGMLPLFLMMIVYFSGVKTGMLPAAVIIATVGTIMSWADGVATVEGVKNSTSAIGFHPPKFLLVDIFQAIPDLAPFIGIIIPVSVTSVANTLMCWQTATKNGDHFSLLETMIADGSGTLLAAIFGCPFGTSVYIGHTTYKKIGARTGYVLLNATTILILTLFGIFAMVQAIIPIQAVAPIILFVGIMTSSDAFESVPFRHIPATIIGFLPSIGDWALNQCSMTTESGESCTINVAPVHAGLVAFKSGSLLVAMILSATFANTIDRKFLQSALWMVAASILSLFGLMHAPEASIDFDNGTPTSQWRFCVAYLMACVVFAGLWALQKWGKNWIPESIDLPEDYLSVLQLVQIAWHNEAAVKKAVDEVMDHQVATWHAEEEDGGLEVDPRVDSRLGSVNARIAPIDALELEGRQDRSSLKKLEAIIDGPDGTAV